MNNPLLNFEKFAPYSKIKPQDVLPALDSVLNDNRAKMQALVKENQNYTWENFIEPMIVLNNRLNLVWSPVRNLHSVADSEELREYYNQGLPKLSEYSSEIGQNPDLYKAYQAVSQSSEFSQYNAAQQQTVNNELRDFRLSGIHLPPEQQARYKEIQLQLSTLSSRFSENVLDSTHAWKKNITDESLLAGLPDSIKALLKQNAEHSGLTGWLITLDNPIYVPCLNYLDNRELRQEIYTAFVSRASEHTRLTNGEITAQWDNLPVMQQILALRHEKVQLLGFKNYAEYSLYTKMAKTPEQVVEFLLDLAKKARPLAEQELAELKAFAQQTAGLTQLEMWDVPYFSEKLRLHNYALSQESLRPYFPLNKVLEGLFAVLQRLYQIQFKTITDGSIETWHSDVKVIEITDKDGKLRGHLYLDVYARAGKRQGAWLDGCIDRHRTADGIQTPIGYIVCNFTPPLNNQPTLLTHGEVLTLFHEFGHGMHHLLTQIDYSPVAGISGVAWDAVELPSQLMENWCWEREALNLISGHYQTGEAIPDDLYHKMIAAKNFQAGLFMLRQIEFSLFDFRLHWQYQPEINVQQVLDEVRKEVSVLVPPAFNRFQNTFNHIFSGGYAAGYYSYKWAEVLSADAFSLFEERGIFDAETGQRFLNTILAKGGSQEAMDLFIAFRGRPPKIDALLRHLGMKN